MTAPTDIYVLRQINAMMLEMKDQLVGALLGKDAMTARLLEEIRGRMTELRKEDYGAQMKTLISDNAAYEYSHGMEQIDSMLAGTGIDAALRVPETSVGIAAGYVGNQITTIPEMALTRVSRTIAMMSLGQNNPSLVAKQLSRDFDITRSHAETIVRTEGAKLQNFGAEARIQDAMDAAQRLGLKVEKVWLHNTASEEIERQRKTAIATHLVSKKAGAGKWRKQQPYRPRPHHAAMNGVAVQDDGMFHLFSPTAGIIYKVAGPHDESLPAEEVINCHCKRGLQVARSRSRAQL